MSAVKAVAFDLDGTLIDTFEHIVRAFELVLPEYGATADRTAITAVIGQTLQQCYEALVPEGDHQAMAKRHHELQQTEEMYALITEYEGLREALAVLEKHHIKKAVVTNRSRVSLGLILDHLQLTDVFNVTITPQEVASPKPSPEGLLAAADQLGVEGAHLAMVGDTAIDITTGQNAGIGKTIGITHGFGSRASLKQAGADVIIDRFDQLPQALGMA